MAMALASALFSAHAGAMSSQAPASAAFDVISSPQTLTLLEADGAMTTYTFADPELAAVAAPDGMVTVYELAPFAPLSEPVIDSVVFTFKYYFPDAADTVTLYTPDGSGWAYVPSNFEPAEDVYVIDDSVTPFYVASFVSPPVYTLTFDQ
jgi:hypothetical protein